MSTAGHEGPGARPRLADEVARRLLASIVDGTYPVGGRLPPEQELAKELGVGRSSMREAVRTLQADGVLRSAHGVGVFVLADRPGSLRPDQALMGGYTMSDLFETRIAIETMASELAARRLTDHHRESLESIIAAAGADDVDDATFVQLDARLHRQVAAASGNPLLLHMWESMHTQFEEYSTRVIGMPGRRERAHRDHCGIVDAILAGSPDVAGGRAREHVLTVQRELQQAGRPGR